MSENTATPSEPEEVEPAACTHVCSEESGCITEVLDCKHEHDEACGYVPATEGTPCTFVCEICNAHDSGDTATPSDAQPEECTCEKLCTEEEINEDCPVCSAEGAELDKVCVGVAPMLPVTALAVAPIGQVLYVGGVQISSTGYWTTDSDGNVTASTAGETPTDNYISYDAENNVLTLHNATIKNELEFNASIEGGTLINGSAIGVFNQSGNAELTISLEGTNTIANVGKGIYVLAHSASTGSSNLTIQGDGSLNASASQTGIWVQSNSGNATLSIENAEVTTTSSSSYGVLVQAKDSSNSNASLTVNGGSLTVTGSGTNFAGIQLQFGSGGSGSGTPTVTVSNNAIVRANGGIANNSSTSIQYGTGNKENGGIVWNGTGGTVYGDVELQEDLEIGEGESLTLDDGASLDAGNHNVIVDGGTLDENLANSLGKSVIYKVTKVELNKTSLTLDVNESETLTATITPGNATNQNVTWSSDNESVATVDANGLVTAVGAGTANIKVETEDGKFTDTCTVTVNPVQYTVTVQTDGSGSASASPASAPAGTAVTLTADPDSGYRFKGWEVVSGGVTISGNQFTMPAGNVTVKAVFVRNSSGFVPTRPWKPSRPVEPEEPEEPETPVLNGWVQEDGVWYLYKDGSMATGWNLYNGTWYYLHDWGGMATGWINLGGAWYYLYDWGGMATGWINLGGAWYYLYDWGGMATGWLNLNGTWYYLYDWGGMATGWLNLNGTWYYLRDWGGMATGWQLINGRWYYFYPGGSMAANTYVNGYYLSGSGAWAE